MNQIKIHLEARYFICQNVNLRSPVETLALLRLLEYVFSCYIQCVTGCFFVICVSENWFKAPFFQWRHPDQTSILFLHGIKWMWKRQVRSWDWHFHRNVFSGAVHHTLTQDLHQRLLRTLLQSMIGQLMEKLTEGNIICVLQSRRW